MVKMQAMTRKDPAAVALGRKGGQARVRNQTPEERTASARRAAEARWAKMEKLAAEITQGTKALLKKSHASQARVAKQKEKQP